MHATGMLRPLLLVALLAAAGTIHAQPERRFDCSRAKDPQACEERLAKARAAQEKARKACEGRQGEERRECLRRERCAQSADPARCEAHAKERASQRAKTREACKGKKGEELRACIREQHRK